MFKLPMHWVEDKYTEYTEIPWNTFEQHWWSFPIELLIVMFCFVGFHVASEHHLLKSLDSFSRKWNISHQTAQPTIYALGAVAPIIILSNVSFATDILQRTDRVHRLGVCSILGFGAATAALIPSSCVFCLVGHIVVPKGTTIRDGVFIIILLVMFLTVAITGNVLWWKTCSMAAIYFAYLFAVVCFPKIKERILSPNPLETNRLLQQLRRNKIGVDIFNRPLAKQSLVDQTYLAVEDRESALMADEEAASPFDSGALLNRQSKLNENPCAVQPAEDINRSNYTTISTSPARKFIALQHGVTSLSHPMLMSQYDADYPLEDGIGFPSDIDEEYEENEGSPTHSKTENAEDDTGSINKIFLRTPTQQKKTRYIYPSIQFESLNHRNFPNLPANTDSAVSKSPSTRKSKLMAMAEAVFIWITKIHRIVSCPVRLLLQCTIPPCGPLDRCECLYPLTFAVSILYIMAFAFALIRVTYHWSEHYQWSLSIMGMVYIGPICTLSNIVDSCALSLSGYSAEVVVNSYHYQISNFFFGIILPLIGASLLDAIDHINTFVEEAISVYLTVLLSQSALLLLPLLCNSNNIELTRPKGWIFIFVYGVAMFCFYYFVSL